MLKLFMAVICRLAIKYYIHSIIVTKKYICECTFGVNKKYEKIYHQSGHQVSSSLYFQDLLNEIKVNC